MQTLLWAFQVLLAIIFGYSGFMKSTRTREQLVRMGQTGVADLSVPVIRFIGCTELLGTAGIILPWAMQVLPVLTPVTAGCFAIIMTLALPIHYKRKEYGPVALNAVVFAISAYVAYMRYAQLA